MTATKSLSEMTTTELLLADQAVGNALDTADKANDAKWAATEARIQAGEPEVDEPKTFVLIELLRRRREIRAELNKRHELKTQTQGV